jgi:hypothetical protein
MTAYLLDVFCGAGGTAEGYRRAGFTVVGVDKLAQRHFPFEFRRADALDVLAELADWLAKRGRSRFVAVHASPPCQRYSNGAKKWGTTEDHPDLIAPTRELLQATGLPYVIENIEAARGHLIDPVTLCGTQFDLGVFRHRCFEASGFTLRAPEHRPHEGRIGDGRYVTVTGHAGGSSARDGWTNGSTDDWRRAMGIDWMSGSELTEAIPPAYTEFAVGN